MKKVREECGIFGIFSLECKDVSSPVYFGLHALQHRGQEGCGIVVADDGVLRSYKDLGLVNEVFTQPILASLGQGNMAIGHVRYGKSDSNDRNNCQPMVVNHIKGRIAIALNGCLTNAFELRKSLEMEGCIFHTSSDTEVISYIITKERLKTGTIEEAVKNAVAKLKGAFTLLIMSPTKMIAVRDGNGIRPLCYGKTKSGDYVIASETCALDVVNAKLVRDIMPGEIMVFSKEKIFSITEYCNQKKPALCIFEYVYFARPDSVIEGCSVHEARLRAGMFLAREHAVEADVVIGVPDSGIDGAIGYANESGIPYGIGFIKNRYIGRTFIAPEQKTREKAVKMKLNAVRRTVEGKRVVLIDDSIVRGTTCAVIVNLLRKAGAKEVHMRLTSPPFIGACYYGTDIDNPNKLIANNHSVEEIAKIIGVDSLGYLSLENLVKTPNAPDDRTYCHACFDLKYPTEVPEQTFVDKFDSKISEKGDKE